MIGWCEWGFLSFFNFFLKNSEQIPFSSHKSKSEMLLAQP